MPGRLPGMIALNASIGRNHMIYELRIYQCIPGKLPALLKRFETKTLESGRSTASGRPASGPC